MVKMLLVEIGNSNHAQDGVYQKYGLIRIKKEELTQLGNFYMLYKNRFPDTYNYSGFLEFLKSLDFQFEEVETEQLDFA